MGFSLVNRQGNNYTAGNLLYDSVATENMVGPVENLVVSDSDIVTCLRLLTAGVVSIGGMTNGVHGRQLLLSNEGAFSVTIVANSVNSLPENRFLASATIAVGNTLWCMYSETVNGWLIAAGSASGGGGVTSLAAALPVTVDAATGAVTIDINTFVASGAGHARGVVPDPGAVAGTTRFLREDATFAIPAGGSPGGAVNNVQLNDGASGFAGSNKFSYDASTDVLSLGAGTAQTIDTTDAMLTVNTGNGVIQFIAQGSFVTIAYGNVNLLTNINAAFETQSKNFDNGATASAGFAAINDTNTSRFLRTSTGFSGTYLTNGPTGEATYIDCETAKPLSIGIAGTEAARVDENRNVTINDGFAALDIDYTAPATGFSYTLGDNAYGAVFNPAGTLATGTVTLPANPIDGQMVEFSTTQTITALTVAANAGQSINNAPTTLIAGGGFSYRYRLSNTTWYRRF